ncbi:MAG: DUF2634 domain-containing protein [Candidatus Merdivicinus sp.]|jgi:phage baseplate assembly protein W
MSVLLPETTDYRSSQVMGSRTWKIDWQQNRIYGQISGLDALQQALQLALLTPRFHFPIYSFQYGSELESLIGSDPDYAVAAAPAMAEEAIAVDDRVLSVHAGSFIADGTTLSGLVTVSANDGELLLPIISQKGV